MEPKTNVANTKTWLEVSSRIRIRAYIESYTPTLSIHERSLSSENLYEVLREISVPLRVGRTAATERQLETEFQAWDILSDEALMNFERELG